MSLFQKSVLKRYLAELPQEQILNAYQAFQQIFNNPVKQQNILNSKEEQYQEGFLRELFVKVLGYVLNPDVDYNLITEQKNEKDSKKADGAILNGLSVIAVIELKSTKTVDLATIESQAFGYKNNQQACKYVITSNFRKLRFYIDNAVDFEEFDLFNLSLDQFKLLWICLSAKHLLKNIPAQIKEASNHEEENVTKKLYADYAKFRTDLFQNIILKNLDFDRLVLFKKTQKLLDRFLFLFFAEDRGLVSPNWTRKILQDWTDLKDKYDNYIPLYNRFRKNFDYLNTGYSGKDGEIFAYNGGLFAPDGVLDSLSIDDDLLFKGSLKLSNYDFESEVDVNILGHIFEHSLNEIDEIQASLADEKTEKVSKRKKDGVFYTPKYITKYIVENTIGTLCKEQKEKLEIKDEEFEFIDAKAKGKDKIKRETLNQKITDYRNWLLELKIVDPACGSGAFLNQALEFLIAEHTKLDELKATLLGGSLVLSDVENSILENNLYGVDINEEAVEIAKLSLWLRTARKGRKLNSLNQNLKCGNSLIDDVEVAGDKAFNWDNEFNEVFEKGGFDVVIGNPPFAGRNSSINELEKQFVKNRFITSEGKFELYQLFIEKCFDIAKDQTSYISLITPQTWLSIIQATKLRKLVFENMELSEIVFLGKDVFEDASVDSVVFVISCGQQNSSINFLESKNLLNFGNKNSIISYSNINNESFIIPLSSDKDSIYLLDKIKARTITLDKIGTWSDGVKVVGFAKDFAFQKTKVNDSFFPMLVGKDIDRYTINWSGLYCCRDKKEIEKYNATDIRLRGESMFKRDKILIRKTGNEIISTIDRNNYYNEQSLFNYGLDVEGHSLNYILGILNSKLANFILKENAFSKKDTFPQIRLHWLKEFPIPKKSFNKEIDKLVIEIQEYFKSYYLSINKFFKFFSTQLSLLSTNNKLQSWNELDFPEFIKEINYSINKSGKEKLTKSSELEWMEIFEEQKVKALAIKTQIEETDKEIDIMVYELYELTEDEIKIVESS